MKTYKISECGRIDLKGNLLIPMDRVREFFRGNKGKRIIVKFECVEDATELQIFYYEKYIVPTMCAALHENGVRLNQEKTDEYLVFEYPGDSLTPMGTNARKGRELNKAQMSDFIDWLKQYAAENYSVYIEDSQNI